MVKNFYVCHCDVLLCWTQQDLGNKFELCQIVFVMRETEKEKVKQTKTIQTKQKGLH